MTTVVSLARKLVPMACHVPTCRKDDCWLSMRGAPKARLLVDLDCDALAIPTGTKLCDYILFGRHEMTTWIAPIELKADTFHGGDVVARLQGGADLASRWIEPNAEFRLRPILVYGTVAERERLAALRKTKIRLQGRQRQTVLIRSGEPIAKALR